MEESHDVPKPAAGNNTGLNESEEDEVEPLLNGEGDGEASQTEAAKVPNEPNVIQLEVIQGPNSQNGAKQVEESHDEPKPAAGNNTGLNVSEEDEVEVEPLLNGEGDEASQTESAKVPNEVLDS